MHARRYVLLLVAGQQPQTEKSTSDIAASARTLALEPKLPLSHPLSQDPGANGREDARNASMYGSLDVWMHRCLYAYECGLKWRYACELVYYTYGWMG